MIGEAQVGWTLSARPCTLVLSGGWTWAPPLMVRLQRQDSDPRAEAHLVGRVGEKGDRAWVIVAS